MLKFLDTLNMDKNPFEIILLQSSIGSVEMFVYSANGLGHQSTLVLFCGSEAEMFGKLWSKRTIMGREST